MSRRRTFEDVLKENNIKFEDDIAYGESEEFTDDDIDDIFDESDEVFTEGEELTDDDIDDIFDECGNRFSDETECDYSREKREPLYSTESDEAFGDEFEEEFKKFKERNCRRKPEDERNMAFRERKKCEPIEEEDDAFEGKLSFKKLPKKSDSDIDLESGIRFKALHNEPDSDIDLECGNMTEAKKSKDEGESEDDTKIDMVSAVFKEIPAKDMAKIVAKLFDDEIDSMFDKLNDLGVFNDDCYDVDKNKFDYDCFKENNGDFLGERYLREADVAKQTQKLYDKFVKFLNASGAKIKLTNTLEVLNKAFSVYNLIREEANKYNMYYEPDKSYETSGLRDELASRIEKFNNTYSKGIVTAEIDCGGKSASSFLLRSKGNVEIAFKITSVLGQKQGNFSASGNKVTILNALVIKPDGIYIKGMSRNDDLLILEKGNNAWSSKLADDVRTWKADKDTWKRAIKAIKSIK